jgi:hypothetical protein
MGTNVIDARRAFGSRTVEQASSDEQIDTASRVFESAVDRCQNLNVLPDAITTALTVQMLKLADTYNWSEEKRKTLFSPALLRLVSGQDDAPY